MKIIVVAILLFFANKGYNQALFEIEEAVSFFTVDNQQQIYTCTNTELKKYSVSGKLLYAFSDMLNGEISAIDVLNPLRILVFYKETNQLVYLNKQLAPISEAVNLYEQTEMELLMVGASFQNGFWAYANEKQSLLFFNNKLDIEKESQNLAAWIRDEDVFFVKEYNQHVYLGLKNKIIVCDMFGAYLSTIHFKQAEQIYPGINSICYVANNSLVEYSLDNKVENIMTREGINNAIGIICDNTKVYIADENSVKIFKK